MAAIIFILLLFLSKAGAPPPLTTCKTITNFQEECHVYDFSVTGCDPWDLSGCANPIIEANILCVTYECVSLWKIMQILICLAKNKFL